MGPASTELILKGFLKVLEVCENSGRIIHFLVKFFVTIWVKKY